MRETEHKIEVEFLSTPSARRATNTGLAVGLFTDISIHALREEGDLSDLRQLAAPPLISIHALREEGDIPFLQSGMFPGRFLSTPSARRATLLRPSRPPLLTYFYPRPPRGGRR